MLVMIMPRHHLCTLECPKKAKWNQVLRKELVCNRAVSKQHTDCRLNRAVLLRVVQLQVHVSTSQRLTPFAHCKPPWRASQSHLWRMFSALWTFSSRPQATRTSSWPLTCPRWRTMLLLATLVTSTMRSTWLDSSDGRVHTNLPVLHYPSLKSTHTYLARWFM